jgi:hypothetical protein
VHRISKQELLKGLLSVNTKMSASQSQPAPGSLFPNGKGKNTKVSSRLLFLFLRPDLQKKTQNKHYLTEVLLSEYSSGLEAGARVRKQGKQEGQQSVPSEPGP